MDALGLEALGIEAPKEYRFYDGAVTLQFDEEEHSYTRYAESGIVLVPGVTTVIHATIDKSAALTQWAANLTCDHIRAKMADLFCLTNDVHIDMETVESWLNDARFNFKDYTKKAADTGHVAHAWLEQYIRADKRNDHDKLQLLMAVMPEDERAKNGVIAALDWMQKHRVIWLYTERKIYSRTYDYAGTMDGLAYVSSCNDPECSCCGYIDAETGEKKAYEFVNVLSVVDWKTSNRLYYPEYAMQAAAYLWAHAEEFPEQRAKLRFINRLGKEDAQFESSRHSDEDFELEFQTYIQCLYLYKSLELSKQRISERKAAIKAALQIAKEAALKIKCSYADKYKGSRKPNCNKGNPCQTCLAKYEQRQREKDSDAVIQLVAAAAGLSSTGTADTVSGV